MITENTKYILNEELNKLKGMTYSEFIEKMHKPFRYVINIGHYNYQAEVKIKYEKHDPENIKVELSIKDLGIKAFIPLTDFFIMTPEGNITSNSLV